MAQRFATALAGNLGVDPACVITAHEDVPLLLAAETALPVNVDPLRADLKRPDERARLARLLQQGLDRPAGFVLPLRAAASDGDSVAPGAAAAGRCAAAACTCRRANRRWDCACRCPRCPTCCRPTPIPSATSTLSPRAVCCRIPRRCRRARPRRAL